MVVTINMSIPESCAECRLSVRHFGKLYCPPLNDRVGNEGKDSRCPLVDAGDHFAEVSKKGDMISRADAIDAFEKELSAEYNRREFAISFVGVENILHNLPSVQPEPAIPLSWIEGQIEWLKSLDNAFSTLTAGQISAMVNKWKDEQKEGVLND